MDAPVRARRGWTCSACLASSDASRTAECAPSDSVTRTESSFESPFDRSYTSKLRDN